MKYPVYVHQEESSAYGMVVPDFPGCFAAADREEEIESAVQEAVELYMDGEDLLLPEPSSLLSLSASGDFRGGVWLWVDVDESVMDTKAERINMTMKGGLLRRLDRFAKQHGQNRSAVIADAVERHLRTAKRA